MTQQNALSTYQTYVEAWKPISDEERRSIVSEVLDADIAYFAPAFQGGPDAAMQDMERFQNQYPGCHFEVENVSFHHDAALFKWVLVMSDGKVTVKGHDCIRFSPAGKIKSLVTFGPASPKA